MIQFVSDLRQVGGFVRLLRFSPNNTTDYHDIAKILLKVALNTITTIHILQEYNWLALKIYLNCLSSISDKVQFTHNDNLPKYSFHLYLTRVQLTRIENLLKLSFIYFRQKYNLLTMTIYRNTLFIYIWQEYNWLTLPIYLNTLSFYIWQE